MTRVRRALIGAMTAALACGAMAAASSDVALAHAELIATTPAASSVLTEAPPLIVLEFDEELDVPLSSIQLFDQKARPVVVGKTVQAVEPTSVQASVPPLDDGIYAVAWSVWSADGHAENGTFTFQIGNGAVVDTAKLIDTVLHGARPEPVVGHALSVARFAAFAGLVLLLGGLFMVAMRAAPEAGPLDWAARRLLWIGWLLLVVGSAANFGLLGARAVAGGLRDTFDTTVWSKIADTRTGGLLVARLGFVIAFVALLANLGARKRMWWRIVAVLLGLLTIFTFSGAGHPSVERHAALWIGNDAVHLACVALWLGSLVMLAVGGRAWLADERNASAVVRFSRMATVAVPLIVATGVLQAWRIGGGLSTLTDTTWGRLLLAKGAVVVLLITIGGASRWLLQNSGPRSLRRTVVAEALLGVVVLALAAGLVGSAP